MREMAGQPDNSPTPHGTSQDRGVLDEALEPEQIRALNSSLRQLADSGGASKELQDTAKRLLSGRLALRDALDDPEAARALGADMASLRHQWDALSDDEREQVRHGEPVGSGDSSSGSSELRHTERRTESESSQAGKQPGKKGQGRHSGGFSLY